MPDLKISELPTATAIADADVTALVQSGPTPTTRRASLSQLRRAVLTDRGVDVRDFGAIGDGVANDAPAIQAAINALGAAGGVVHLGRRTYRLTSAITITSASIRLQGAGFTEGGGPGDGTWLTVSTMGFTPITFTGVATRGSAVRDIAIRQTQGAAQNASWAPVDYDWFFRVQDCFGGVDFDNVMFSPVNRGIYCRNSGRMDFHRIRGQVLTAGIEIDEAFDTCRMMNLHFWPFWSSNDNVVRWQQANGDALIFRRCDGVFVDQAFALGYRSMFHFSSSAAGYTQKFSIGQAYADFVRHGIWIDADGTDGQVDAMTVQCEIFNAAGAPMSGSIGIYVNASNSNVQIGSLRIDDVQDNAIRLEQHSNRLDIGALRVVNYNLRNNGAAAIHLANAVTGIANRVNLASPPLLETAVSGPLFNSGTNGSAGLQGPAGEAARPGLAIGQPDTGLYRPVTGGLAAAANGVELLRATGGTLSLGAEPGSHALEVTTPPSAVNRVEMRGGVTGAPGLVGWLAAGADANISVIIGQPKGTGAVTAQFADGAIAGGNARGANAADFQTARSSATQVAGGPNSIISGGQSNTASNSNTVVAGGSFNVSSGNTSTVGGGANNVASATTSTVSGGAANTADGGNAWIPGGRNATTRGLVGRAAWASGAFTIQGDAQSGEHLLRRVTTDATATRLTGDSLAQTTNNTVNLPNSGTYMLRLLVVAQQTGGTAGTAGDCAGWELTSLVKRGASAAATVLVGGSGSSVAPLHASAAAATWRLGLSADTTAGGLALTATGEANKTLRWVARILSVETAA